MTHLRPLITLETNTLYESGDCIAANEPTVRVIRTTEGLKNVLDSLKPTKAIPGLENPVVSRIATTTSEVNLEHSDIVWLSLGQQPTPGYKVSIEKPLEYQPETDELIIQVNITAPSRDAILSQVITFPCTIISHEKKMYSTLTVKDRNGASLIIHNKSFE